MAESERQTGQTPEPFLRLLIGALGVVYGDIGTSPLYAIRESFAGHHPVPINEATVVGVLSLFFWSLTAIVFIKYLAFVLRADNLGEGGILALLSLAWPKNNGRSAASVIALGAFGAALLYADGILTPAISVVSAVEGIGVVTDRLEPFIVPVSCAILVVLFLFQPRGTARVGAVFGPFILVWFVALGATGIPWIVRHPVVLTAVNPLHGLRFLFGDAAGGLTILGSVVLCVTGAEALYADMGHFGRRPIRVGWAYIAFPGLILNYFGQGALLLDDPAAIAHPFYGLVPSSLLIPFVILATGATVIASQALISGAFSLTTQAMQLGFLPRFAVRHTSETARGQIYVPAINWLLMLSCVLLVIGFESSTRIAAAYGLAVTGTMTITTILFYRVAREWWGPRRAALLCGVFMVVDVTFLASTFEKIATGGWFPIAVATGIYVLMVTWRHGRSRLAEFMRAASVSFDELVAQLRESRVKRVPGTAVFMTSSAADVPPVLQHHLRHNRALQEQVILLSITTLPVPRVRRQDIVRAEELGDGFFRVVAHYGFVQTPRVTEVLRCACATAAACTLSRGIPASTSAARCWCSRASLA
jgi:KUP system potassium uptake protein